MLTYNESSTMRGIITVKNITESNPEGEDVVVMNVSATFARGTNQSVQIDEVNKPFILQNIASIQSQIDEFKIAVKTRAQELGYSIFI